MRIVPHVESLGHYNLEVIMPSLLLFTFVPNWLSYLLATVVVVRVADGSNDTTCLLRPSHGGSPGALSCAVAALSTVSLLEGHNKGCVPGGGAAEGEVPMPVPEETQGSLIRGSQHAGGSLGLQKGLWKEADCTRS